MRKINPLLILILIIVGLGLGASYFVGIIAEERYRDAIQVMNEMPGTNVNIASYERGLLQSDADLVFKIMGSDYTIKSKIYHGPVIFKKGKSGFPVQFKLAYVVNQLVGTTLPTAVTDLNPLTWSFAFPYTGGMEVWSNSLPSTIEQGNLVVKAQGWDASGQISRNWDSYDISTASPGFSISGKGQTTPLVDFQMIQIHSDLQKTPNSKVAKVDYHVNKILFPEQNVEIQKPEILAQFITYKEAVDMLFSMTLDNVLLGIAGQGLKVGSEHLQLRFENLDLAAMQLLFKNANTGLNPEQIQEFTNKMVKRGPKIFMDKSVFHLPNGTIVSEGKLIVKGEAVQDPNNIEDVLKNAEGDLLVQVTKALFRDSVIQLQMQNLMQNPSFKALPEDQKQATLQRSMDDFINALMKGGVLKDLGENYEIKATFRNGEWVGIKWDQIFPQGKLGKPGMTSKHTSSSMTPNPATPSPVTSNPAISTPVTPAPATLPSPSQ